MIVDAALRMLSPGHGRGRLSILIFHRVLAEPDTLHTDLPSAEEFDRMMAWVAGWFNVLPLDEAVARLASGSLPPRAAAITFDDGYADNLTQAVPILQRHRLSAAFFIATSYLNGGRMWNDTIAEALRRCRSEQLDLSDLGLGTHPMHDMPARRRALAHILPAAKHLLQPERQAAADAIARRVGADLPQDLMMTTAQLRAMRDAGMQIGAHTVSHPILARIDSGAARQEIEGSKATLEDLLGQPVTLFAYPNGVPEQDYTREHRDLVQRAGFVAACTTSPGSAHRSTDPYQLPRFTPWDRKPTKFGLRMARNLLQTEATV